MKVFQLIERYLLRRRAHGSESGVALVEFALILPVLLLILFAILDFGRAFNYWIDMTHLANEGSRWAVVNNNQGAPSQTLQQYIQSGANTPELRSGGTSQVADPLEVCVAFPGESQATVTAGDPVQVTVKTGYNWLPFIGNALGALPPLTLRAESTMRLEQIPDASKVNVGNNIGDCL